MSESELLYLGHDFVNFDNLSFRWVDIKHFHLPQGLSERGALALLIAHLRYQDHYTTADSYDNPTENIHGPYWLDRITPDSFKPLDEEHALRLATDFANTAGEIEPEVLAALEREVYTPIRSAHIRYHLEDLGEGALHEFGWVLDNFQELVLLEIDASRLDLFVAAAD